MTVIRLLEPTVVDGRMRAVGEIVRVGALPPVPYSVVRNDRQEQGANAKQRADLNALEMKAKGMATKHESVPADREKAKTP